MQPARFDSPRPPPELQVPASALVASLQGALGSSHPVSGFSLAQVSPKSAPTESRQALPSVPSNRLDSQKWGYVWRGKMRRRKEGETWGSQLTESPLPGQQAEGHRERPCGLELTPLTLLYPCTPPPLTFISLALAPPSARTVADSKLSLVPLLPCSARLSCYNPQQLLCTQFWASGVGQTQGAQGWVSLCSGIHRSSSGPQGGTQSNSGS